jgi:hypothetical protein
MRFIIILLATLISGYLTFNIYQLSVKREVLIRDYTEVKNIKYGLLSVHAWKTQVSEIIAKKVREFQITSENRDELRISIERSMYQILDEVENIIQKNRDDLNFIEKLATSIFESLFFSVKDLRNKIPEFTEIILDELDNYETREKLRSFIMAKIDNLLYETVGNEDLSNITKIGEDYECKGIEPCGEILNEKLSEIDSQLNFYCRMIIFFSFFSFLILLIDTKKKEIKEYYLLFATSGILLFGGLTTPMIDIDARINSFNFKLMGESLSFNDQILFHQSKSIIGVIKVLLYTGEIQSILVGCLIFLFSVVFPVSKLIASISVLEDPSIRKNKTMSFLAFKSGKWSMADVMVVAIFMAYIGFKGIIRNQLSQIENLSSRVEILTTDNSNFGIGFLLFAFFCITSLFLSADIEKNV